MRYMKPLPEIASPRSGGYRYLSVWFFTSAFSNVLLKYWS